MKYSLVIANGRIVDPHNGRDAQGDLGIKDGRIVEAGQNLDKTGAERVVDAAGKWVIPGVIDPHMHVSSWIGDYPGLRMMAREGVITALDMAGPPESVFHNIKNHGSGMNIACLSAFTFDTGKGMGELSDDEIRARIARAVKDGAFGVKLLGGHYPISPEMTRKVIKYSAEMGIYVAFHAGTTGKGSNLEGLEEAVELADGNPVHIAHVNSYCRGYIKDALRETADAMDLIGRSPNVWSESYLSIFNGTSGKCRDGEILSHVTKTCCQIKGFGPDHAGLGEAIMAGYARVVKLQGGENVLVTGEEGFQYWKARDTDVTLSFPVNSPEAQIAIALRKDKAGDFIVNSLSTDGGGIPRNTMVRQGLELVRLGAFTPSEFVMKTSRNTARMLGLKNKGHFTSGADADVTVVDPDKAAASMGISLGKIIMVDGVVTGEGGMILTTPDGAARVRGFGTDFTVIEPGEALRKKTG
jgi:hypothetical protein